MKQYNKQPAFKISDHVKPKLFLSLFYLVISSFISIPLLADVASDYPQEAQFAKQNSGKLQDDLKNFNPSNLPGYTSNPAEEKYAKNPDAIKSDESSQYATNTSAQSVVNQFNVGPKFTIDPTSPGIKQGLLAEDDADDISHGIADKYTDCSPSKDCHPVYHSGMCMRSIEHQFNCQSTLNVDVTYDQQGYTCNHIDLSDHYHPHVLPGPDTNNQCYAGIIIWGLNDFSINHTKRLSQTEPLLVPDGVPIQTGVQIYSSPYFLSRSDYAVSSSMTVNNVNNIIQVTRRENNKSNLINVGAFQSPITIQVNYSAWYDFKKILGINQLMILEYVIYPHVPKAIVSESWSNSCMNENNASEFAGCQMQPKVCVQAGESRTINGKVINEPCWQYTTHYICGVNQNECKNYEGCEQTGSRCQTVVNGICLQYQQSYQCQTEQCHTKGMVCGGQLFCIDGDCSEPKPTQNQELGKDAAELAAVAGGISELKDNPGASTAFTGQAMNCSMAPIGFLNCCVDSGWGKDIGLAKCSSEEKKLGEAKQKGLVVKPDNTTYCSSKIAGQCVEERKGYCVFPSKLAVDVQQGGAHDQLGKSFGSGKHPNCTGINLQDLQRIDFSKIDFSNVADEIKNQAEKNMPDQNAVNAAIQQHIHQQMEQKQ